MARRHQVHKLAQLDQQLWQQRLLTRTRGQRPLRSLRRFYGWPVAATGFGLGLIAGHDKAHRSLAKLLAFTLTALRMERVITMVSHRL